jgi:hypothetical protein
LASILSFGDAFANLLGFVQTMSAELNLLRAEVVMPIAKELASNDVIDGLRISILDLEEMFLRETAVDDPVPKMVPKSARDRANMSSKKKKTPITQKGDVLSLKKRGSYWLLQTSPLTRR